MRPCTSARCPCSPANRPWRPGFGHSPGGAPALRWASKRARRSCASASAASASAAPRAARSCSASLRGSRRVGAASGRPTCTREGGAGLEALVCATRSGSASRAFMPVLRWLHCPDGTLHVMRTREARQRALALCAHQMLHPATSISPILCSLVLLSAGRVEARCRGRRLAHARTTTHGCTEGQCAAATAGFSGHAPALLRCQGCNLWFDERRRVRRGRKRRCRRHAAACTGALGSAPLGGWCRPSSVTDQPLLRLLVVCTAGAAPTDVTSTCRAGQQEAVQGPALARHILGLSSCRVPRGSATTWSLYSKYRP